MWPYAAAVALTGLLPAAAARANCVTNGVTVTCSGASAPFDAGGVPGYTVNVLSGANVSGTAGTNTAMQLANTNVVYNFGTISGFTGGNGLAAGDGNQITNYGLITAPDSGYGVWINDNNTVVNRGTISVGDGGIAINVHDNSDLSNVGTITAGAGGTGIAMGDGGGKTIRNDGTITVGANGTGISASVNTVIINNGPITAGANGTSISSLGGAPPGNTITNNGTLDGQILIRNAGSTLTNNGLIEITNAGTAVGTTHVISTFPYNTGGTFIQGAGGTLALRVNNAGAADKLTADTITLNGTLQAVVQAGLYSAPLTYSGVLAACPCGLTGTFATVTSSSPFFTARAVYNYGAGTVDLTLTRMPFGSVSGMTDNQRAVGNALEASYSAGVTGNAATFYSNLFAATSVGVYDQLSGQGTAATQGAAIFSGTMFLALIGQAPFGKVGTPAAPLGYASADAHPVARIIKLRQEDEIARHWQGWASGLGGTRAVDGDATAGTTATSTRAGGGAAGVIYRSDPDLLVGAAVGVSQSHFDVANLATAGNLTAGHVGLHAARRWGAVYAAAALTYAHMTNDTTRTITGVGPTETASGRFGSDMLAGRVEWGWRHELGPAAVTPFAAMQYSVLWQSGYSETSTTAGGAPGVLGLNYAAQSTASFPVTLGAQIDTQIALGGGRVLTPYARLGWVHEFKPDSRIDASFISIPGAAFTVAGARSARDAAQVNSGVRLALNAATVLTASFNSELSERSRSYAANCSLTVAW